MKDNKEALEVDVGLDVQTGPGACLKPSSGGVAEAEFASRYTILQLQLFPGVLSSLQEGCVTLKGRDGKVKKFGQCYKLRPTSVFISHTPSSRPGPCLS